MSSVFLNSPSTRMTSPFSSTSVHRSLGSREAFAVRRRLLLNMDDAWSPSEREGRSSGLSGLEPFLAGRPQSLSCQVGAGVAETSSWAGVFEAASARVAREARRCLAGSLLLDLVLGRSRVSRDARQSREASRCAASRGRTASRVQVVVMRRALPLAYAPEAAACGQVDSDEPWLGLKKATSVWERRKRSRVREGTGARRSAGGIAVRVFGRGA